VRKSEKHAAPINRFFLELFGVVNKGCPSLILKKRHKNRKGRDIRNTRVELARRGESRPYSQAHTHKKGSTETKRKKKGRGGFSKKIPIGGMAEGKGKSMEEGGAMGRSKTGTSSS